MQNVCVCPACECVYVSDTEVGCENEGCERQGKPGNMMRLIPIEQKFDAIALFEFIKKLKTEGRGMNWHLVEGRIRRDERWKTQNQMGK